MGTRADFYVGVGFEAEWIGSIAWDGCPGSLRLHFGEDLFRADTEKKWRKLVAELLRVSRDSTTPDMGWPWPWDDSKTTDYAYAFHAGRVVASCFGRTWFNPRKRHPDVPEFPNMASRRVLAEAGTPRSGVMLLRVPK